MGHGIIHRDAILIFAEVSQFSGGGTEGALQARKLRNLRASLYHRRTPRLVSKDDVFVYLGHWIIHPGCGLIFSEARFSVEVWSSLSH